MNPAGKDINDLSVCQQQVYWLISDSQANSFPNMHLWNLLIIMAILNCARQVAPHRRVAYGTLKTRSNQAKTLLS
jgi:hypothetical protein